VTGQKQTAAQWKEPEQSDPRIDEPLPNLPSRDTALETALEEARTAPEAEALAQAYRGADLLAQELAAARQELEVTKQHAAIALREAAETAQVHAAELSKAHLEEQQRADALAQALIATRQELETARAQVLALQEEQKKSARLAQSLAAARKELKAAKLRSVVAAKRSAETAQAEAAEQGDDRVSETSTVRPKAQAANRQRTNVRQGALEADEDVRAAGPRGAEAALGTSAVTRQPQPIPRQFEWE
jgi:hypothetical protein